MEDAATAEISRSQVWQWLWYRVTFSDGREFTPQLYEEWLPKELARIENELEAPASTPAILTRR